MTDLTTLVAADWEESQYNAKAERHNRIAKTADLLPYRNRAYLDMVGGVSDVRRQLHESTFTTGAQAALSVLAAKLATLLAPKAK